MVMMDGTPIAGLERYNVKSVVINDVVPVAGGAAVKEAVVTIEGPDGTLSLRSYRGAE